MKISVRIVILVSAFCAWNGVIVGQGSGSPDPDFGSGGVTVANVPGSAKIELRKIAFQANGSIVALFEDFDSANNFKSVLGRFTPDGALDSTFGSGGFVYSAWPAGTGGARNIVVQADEKIVISGFAQLGRNAAAMRFERYQPNGAVDSFFGTGGVVSVNTTGGNSLALQPDGKILCMGADGKLVRLNQNGSLDTSFGTGGIAAPKLSLDPWFNGLRVLPSGKIVATGRLVSSNVSNFVVAGYNANGSLDDGGRSDSTPGNQFGSKGYTTISFTGYTGGRGMDIELDSSGRIVVLGAAGTQNSALAVARMSAIGQLDSSFGTAGRIVFTDTNGSPQGTNMGIQTDGRIVVIGGYYMGTAPDGSVLRDAMVVRFLSSGSLDSFDVGQIVQTDTFGGDELGYDGAVRFDPGCACERILWAGVSYAGTSTNIVRTPLMIQYIP